MLKLPTVRSRSDPPKNGPPSTNSTYTDSLLAVEPMSIPQNENPPSSEFEGNSFFEEEEESNIFDDDESRPKKRKLDTPQEGSKKKIKESKTEEPESSEKSKKKQPLSLDSDLSGHTLRQVMKATGGKITKAQERRNVFNYFFL